MMRSRPVGVKALRATPTRYSERHEGRKNAHPVEVSEADSVWRKGKKEKQKKLDTLTSVIVNYITRCRIQGVSLAPEYARENPDPKVKKLKENEDESPSLYAVRCSDVALHRSFCPVRRAKTYCAVLSARVLRGSCA